MLQQKNKKILVYFLLFFVIGTMNNKNLNKINFPKIKQINIIGLDEKDNLELLDNLNFLKIYNLFTLNKIEIQNRIDSNKLIEKYFVFKKYPSSIDIKINKTKFLAQIKKGDEIFLLGSNSRLIKAMSTNKSIPFIFGDFKHESFFELKEVIDNSNFDYGNIKNLFYFKSGRWDIEMESGLILKLPKKNLKNSFNLFLEIIKKESQKNINIIDLRQHNQIIING